MNKAQTSFLHVSQNIPTNSPLEVKMDQPIRSQIHISQVSQSEHRSTPVRSANQITYPHQPIRSRINTSQVSQSDYRSTSARSANQITDTHQPGQPI